MILLDSNVVIYAFNPAYPTVRQFVVENKTAVSAISYVEAMGFHNLQPWERRGLEKYFGSAPRLPLDGPVLDRAVALRQQRKMSLGDALVAATALLYGLPLATNNPQDFRHIPELRLLNPISA